MCVGSFEDANDCVWFCHELLQNIIHNVVGGLHDCLKLEDIKPNVLERIPNE